MCSPNRVCNRARAHCGHGRGYGGGCAVRRRGRIHIEGVVVSTSGPQHSTTQHNAHLRRTAPSLLRLLSSQAPPHSSAHTWGRGGRGCEGWLWPRRIVMDRDGIVVRSEIARDGSRCIPDMGAADGNSRWSTVRFRSTHTAHGREVKGDGAAVGEQAHAAGRGGGSGDRVVAVVHGWSGVRGRGATRT